MSRILRIRGGVAAVASVLLLSGCGGAEDSALIRPGSQPLERLNTPEARARTAAAMPRPSQMPAGQAADMCGEVVRISEQGRLILDRSDPRRLVVDQALWGLLPQEVQRGLIECVESMRPAAARGGPMRVVSGAG